MDCFNKIYFLLGLVLIFKSCQTQTLTLLNNVEITYTNNGRQTEFVVRSALGNNVNPNNAWLGIGFSSRNVMDGSSVVVCMRTNSFAMVRHFYNQGYSSIILDTSNPSLGLSNTLVEVQNGVMSCRFTRENTLDNVRYHNLNSATTFISAAYNTMGADPTALGGHGTNRQVIATAVNFPIASTTTATTVPQTTVASSTANPTTTSAASSSAVPSTTVPSSTAAAGVATTIVSTSTTTTKNSSNIVSYHVNLLLASLLMNLILS